MQPDATYRIDQKQRFHGDDPMSATATATGKKWGRVGEAAEILGVRPPLVLAIATRAGVLTRKFPATKGRLYDLHAIRRLAEECTKLGRG